jgi:hypothetical protein
MDYCKLCSTCAMSKSPTERPHRLLKTMLVLMHPWQYIRIDFVGLSPESMNWNRMFDVICIIINLLTTMIHLMPTKQTYKAADWQCY